MKNQTITVEMSRYEAKIDISALEEYKLRKLELATKSSSKAAKGLQLDDANEAEALGERIIQLLDE